MGNKIKLKFILISLLIIRFNYILAFIYGGLRRAGKVNILICKKC
jgi:hypothetical protein